MNINAINEYIDLKFKNETLNIDSLIDLYNSFDMGKFTDQQIKKIIDTNMKLNQAITDLVFLSVDSVMDEDSKLPKEVDRFVKVFLSTTNMELEADYDSFDEKDFTEMPSSIKMYLSEIGKIPVFTPDEEIVKFTQYNMAEGKEKEKIKEEIIKANLKLVVSIAKGYSKRLKKLDFLDLIQEGNIGLITAIDKFDVTKGYKFSTYASWWIKQTITRNIYDRDSSIRIPVHLQEQMKKVRKAYFELQQKTGKAPTLEMVSEVLDMNVKTVNELVCYIQKFDVMSLETPVGEEGDSNLVDFIPDEGNAQVQDDVEKSSIRDLLIEKVFSRYGTGRSILTPGEKLSLMARYGIVPKSLEELIGILYGDPKSLEKILEEVCKDAETLDDIKILVASNPKILEDINECVFGHPISLEDMVGLLNGRSRTLEEVGKILNVTRERIRQVEKKGMKKARSLLGNDEIDYSNNPESLKKSKQKGNGYSGYNKTKLN